MFKKILIANRGEIACRVIRTAKKLGIHTVAIYSSADAQALHVKLADEAYFVGPSPSAESYLRGKAIIEIATTAGAEAIHPGYGFLSENADFAELCAAAGICFIGPPPDAIRAMGIKSTAKHIMEQAGVPVIKGYHGENQDEASLRQAAAEIGYPVLIKAVAGGGGKGMRVVQDDQEFIAGLDAARREAKASFGDDRVLLEKYLHNPRHVEVQVFADNHGHALYLFERDCSVQRRHQKIIEEAPAPGISENLRAAMGEAGVNAARAIHYRGAGTIEFLLDSQGDFYFMEMNTRLQVEHPVTEMITGQDLVEWQLRVAYGETLPITEQKQLKISGHAFEARIYAEDPQKDFMPSTGVLNYLAMPENKHPIRIDSGVVQGDTISVYYDPMIAKLLAWGEDRDIAISRLREALENVQVIGVHTNVPLLLALATQADFSAGRISTHYIEQHHDSLFAPAETIPSKVLALAALAAQQQNRRLVNTWRETSNDPYSPWFAADHWRSNLAAQQTISLREDQQNFTIIAEIIEGEIKTLTINNEKMAVSAFQAIDQEFSALIDQQLIKATIIFFPPLLHVFSQGQQYVLSTAAAQSTEQTAENQQQIIAPMPGALTEIFVQPGQQVKKGERLLVVEAMKMQHTLYAPIDGSIKEIFFSRGDLVEEGTQLLELI